MISVYGESADCLLFTDGTRAVAINKYTNMVDDVAELPVLASWGTWTHCAATPSTSQVDLAKGALSDLSITIVASTSRMYTIPKSVASEAERGLAWRKEEKRGGTAVGLSTARRLSNGGQVGIEKVRHIAKYFPRHEVDKKGKGYKPGSDNYPSNGRIAWALWGGDAGWSWAQAIVDRENKKAKSMSAGAGNYTMNDGPGADLNAFKIAYELDNSYAPDFVARVRVEDNCVDRLYKVDTTGEVTVWDDGAWDTLGHVDHDIYTADKSMDDPYDTSEKRHILLDIDSALIISARLQANPFTPVAVDDLDPEESALVLSAANDIDWVAADYAIVAAGDAPTGGVVEGDGVYSGKERSVNASSQVRDKSGKFAQRGSRVVVNGNTDSRGEITKLEPASDSVVVKLDSGEEISVLGKNTELEASFKAMATPGSETTEVPPLDVDGILSPPKVTSTGAIARVDGSTAPFTSKEISDIISDYPSYIIEAKAKGMVTPDIDRSVAQAKAIGKSDYLKGLEEASGVLLYDDARENPLLKSFFKKAKNKVNFSPITSAIDGASAHAAEVTAIANSKAKVHPMYLAVVSPEDPQAVFDLIAIVPAGATSTMPMCYTRKEQKWVRDEKMLADITSASPPPVVPVYGQAYLDVLAQVDEQVITAAIIAQGGLDKNRGNADKLRHYWLYGRGALKIRWNTPGDWTRCYRHLSKYMGLRAKGYCALRHKEATGLWTGDKLHRQMHGSKSKAHRMFSTTDILSSEAVHAAAYLRAAARLARNRVVLATGTLAPSTTEEADAGSSFTIALVLPEGISSGDGRTFAKNSVTMREMPIPLLWQIKTGDGHDGSVVVGRINSMERIEGGLGNAKGVFDTSPHAQEAERMIAEGFMRGVSADLDMFEANDDNKASEAESNAKKDDGKIGGEKMTITKARVMAVTIVPKPAFEQCRIAIDGSIDEYQAEEPLMLKDGEHIATEDITPIEAAALVACGAISASIPVVPPATWFTDPKLDKATPLTVDDNGRVFGHIAAWHTDHIGMSYGTRPPRSKSKYAFFHTGVVRTDDGKDTAVGNLTLAGGHASLEASAAEAVRHYDDTASAIADVHAGEDKHGIWVAGALRPGTTPERVRVFRASAPSGDWRPIKGALELVAVCQVNVPGFPIARARVASGQVYALVAAGAAVLAKMKNDPISTLEMRIAALETSGHIDSTNATVAAIRSKFTIAKAEQLATLAAANPCWEGYMMVGMKKGKGGKMVPNCVPKDNAAVGLVADAELSLTLAARQAELTAQFHSSFDYESLAFISRKERMKLAESRVALPDGSFPIRDEEDLKQAISSFGRAKKTRKAAVRRHIMRKARTLKRYDLIPDNWKELASFEESTSSLSMRVAAMQKQLAQSLVAAPIDSAVPVRDAKYVSGVNQPRDASGMFRQVLARLKHDLGTSGLDDVISEIEQVENLDDAGNYGASVAAAQSLLQTLDRLDSGALNSSSIAAIKATTAELGAVLANLPLPFGNNAQKVVYTDLPPVLQSLMDDMIKNVEAKVGQEDADQATAKLRNFKAGGDSFSQEEISSELNVLLRLLT